DHDYKVTYLLCRYDQQLIQYLYHKNKSIASMVEVYKLIIRGVIDDALHCRFGKVKMIKGYESMKIDKETIDEIIEFIQEFYQSYMCSFYGIQPDKMKHFIELSEDDLRQLKKFGILINLINCAYEGKTFDAEAYGENMDLSKTYDSLCSWKREVA
ncbi:MAG: hypothetical protein PHF63_13005, partial [Herbinix sp.]|nr:hypothetical protein [Herbinix sp.]